MPVISANTTMPQFSSEEASTQNRVAVVVPGPFRKAFHYLVDSKQDLTGCRVWVHFGKQRLMGIVTESFCAQEEGDYTLKPIDELIDSAPLFEPALHKMIESLARYYHDPLGNCIHAAMLAPLREGGSLTTTEPIISLTEEGTSITSDKLARAPKQQDTLNWLREHAPISRHNALALGVRMNALKPLLEKGWACIEEHTVIPRQTKKNTLPMWHTLNAEQRAVGDSLVSKSENYSVQVLRGVTGSGKTEVYCHLMQHILDQGKQVLVLVPEIGLTPQMLARFEARFQAPIVTLHSMLTEEEKMHAWACTKMGTARIVIGTRSAIFMPMPSLGLIVIDEEHDASYKQQQAPRYHARDMAILRAKYTNVPILLGSATPSLETLYQAEQGHYHLHHLEKRAGEGAQPAYHLIDMRQQVCQGGISLPLSKEISKHLAEDHQVLLFLNRRGYAHALICHACGWAARCKHCDAFYTLHVHHVALVCHHCGHQQEIIRVCPDCHERDLRPVGCGTEKIEEALTQAFPNENVIRVDRDVTQKKGALEGKLNQIHEHHARLIVGTQMLAKGHHFSRLNMVGIVDTDTALYSADFRAIERLGQLMLQVAGRAGREGNKGEVFIQTHQSEHPALHTLLREGYMAFAQKLLDERKIADLPPYTYMALIRAEAKKPEECRTFLNNARNFFEHLSGNIEVLGPIPALRAKKKDWYRVQLFINTKDRPTLHRALRAWLQEQEQTKHRKVRWSCEVDPYDLSS